MIKNVKRLLVGIIQTNKHTIKQPKKIRKDTEKAELLPRRPNLRLYQAAFHI